LTSFNLTTLFDLKLPQATTGTAYIGGSGSPRNFSAIEGLRYELHYEDFEHENLEVLINTLEVPIEKT
jgi:hypothetical protein